jgi:ADP-heptose:LPS heptosyltransferase
VRTGGTNKDFWRGEDLSSKTLLVRFTDGLGEHILQSTFIKDIAALAPNCIVECSKRLAPILHRSFPNIEVISGYDRDAVNGALERADYQIPAFNMGRYVRKSFDQFDSEKHAHLAADPELVQHYREKYLERAHGRRIVGLSWMSGNPKIGKYKTLELETLKPLLNSKDMHFVSLQYGEVNDLLAEFAKDTGIDIYTDPDVDQLTDLEHFFAQVAALDLVITISSSAAHVAGSLGVPTWVMLPQQGTGPLWFWFMDRADSPWYSSVRLFRQQSTPSPDNPWWPEVVEDVADALSTWLVEPLAPRPLP